MAERNGILFVSYKRNGKPVTKLFKTMIGAQRHVAALEAARALRVIAAPQS